VRPEQLKGRRKICFYLTNEAYAKLQTARGFGETTNLAIAKAIKQLLEEPEKIKPIRRRRVYVRMAALRFLILSQFCRSAGLTMSQLVDLALRKYTPIDPVKQYEALKKKLQSIQEQKTRPKSNRSSLEFCRGEGSRRQATALSHGDRLMSSVPPQDLAEPSNSFSFL